MPLPSVPLFVLAGALPLFTPRAWAGGVGLVGTGGTHQEYVYYYDDNEDQYLNVQYRPNFGGGIELVLGDKDDRIQGVGRAYYLQDSPPVDPPDPLVSNPTYNIPDDPEHIGMFMAGVQWGLLGDPTGLQGYLSTMAGGGVVTVDNLEFIQVNVGVGGSWLLPSMVQVFAEAAATGRYRKSVYPGFDLFAGVRYLFD